MNSDNFVLTALGFNGMPIQALRPTRMLGNQNALGADTVFEYTIPKTYTEKRPNPVPGDPELDIVLPLRGPQVLFIVCLKMAWMRIREEGDASNMTVADDNGANAFLAPADVPLYFTVMPGQTIQMRRVGGNNNGWTLALCDNVNIIQR